MVMKLKDMIPATAKVLGKPEASVALCARQLREAGLIASRGRGPGGAIMSSADCSALLLGVAASPTIKDSVAYVNAFKEMRAKSRLNRTNGMSDIFPENITMLEHISVLIESAKDGRLDQVFEEEGAGAFDRNMGFTITFNRPMPSGSIEFYGSKKGSLLFEALYSLPTLKYDEFYNKQIAQLYSEGATINILDPYWLDFGALARPKSSLGDLRESSQISHSPIFYLGYLLR